MFPPTQICVVTPSFNAAETIERTIVSVLSQAGDFDLYYHVQDGGSTDGTVALLEKWRGIVAAKTLPSFCRSIHFSYKSEKDDGLYGAIIDGFKTFKMTEDSWMGWINADDLLVPGTCATLALIDATPAERHMKWVIGSTGVVNHDAVISHAPRPIGPDIVREGLCDGSHWHFIQQEGIFFRNILWKRVDTENGFRKLKYAGDWNLWRLMAQNHRLYQIDRSLGLFRIRAGQISQQFRGEYEEETETLVPRGHRMTALRRLAASSPKRYVMTFRYPDGHVSFREENLATEAEEWVRKRVGPNHDADWQFPAVTEKQAYANALRSMPTFKDVSYFAFPWATLIDQIDNGADPSKLLGALKALARRSPRTKRMVTVCQHVKMLHHRALFEEAGITDVFWSHATKSMRGWPGPTRINLHPFPLYPVQIPEARRYADDERRPHLFSFVGAAGNSWYLTEVRDWILRDLSNDPRGIVIGRGGWHYDKVVYDHQIKGIATTAEKLVDQSASQEFQKLLAASTFALCPSGSGPNSIRLWEAIGAGAIPVILADTYAPPGPAALWDEAAVFCAETEEALAALPDRLEAMAADPALIARKRRALRQLWLLYGPDNFIHDIRKLAFAEASRALPAPPAGAQPQPRIRVGLIGRHSNRTPLSYPAYAPFFAGRIEIVKRLEDAEILVTGFDIDFRENMETVARLKAQNPRLRLAVVSEEPLWDTIWAVGFRERTLSVAEQGHTVRYAAINHVNSDVYDFASLPYFVTTTDEFPARYNHLFTRNAALTPEAVLQRWSQAAIPAAFFAEKRLEPQYSKAHPELGVHGLSAYRSEVAALFKRDGVLREGQGWTDGPKRQALADWHLDKLATLDGRALFVSAIENTHQRSYVTEKLFDAFAVGAVPLYWAAKDHAVHRVIQGGFVNLHDKTPQQAADAIATWKPDLDFAKKWIGAQRELAARFSDPQLLARERDRLAKRVISQLEQVAQGAWPGLDEVAAPPPAPEPARPSPVAAAPAEKAAPTEAARAVEKAAPARAPVSTSKKRTAEPAAAPKAATAKSAPARAAARASDDVPVAAEEAVEAAPPAPTRWRGFSAKVAELTKLPSGYKHLNIHVENLQIEGYLISDMYFKLQIIDEDQYGLQFEKNEIVMNDNFDWLDEYDQDTSRINIYFGSDAYALWSSKAGSEADRFVHRIVAELPAILAACEADNRAVKLAPWDAAIAAACTLSASLLSTSTSA